MRSRSHGHTRRGCPLFLPHSLQAIAAHFSSPPFALPLLFSLPAAFHPFPLSPTTQTRLEVMRAMLRDFQEDGVLDNEPEHDPFIDQPRDMLVGRATVNLAPLAIQPGPLVAGP